MQKVSNTAGLPQGCESSHIIAVLHIHERYRTGVVRKKSKNETVQSIHEKCTRKLLRTAGRTGIGAIAQVSEISHRYRSYRTGLISHKCADKKNKNEAIQLDLRACIGVIARIAVVAQDCEQSDKNEIIQITIAHLTVVSSSSRRTAWARG